MPRRLLSAGAGFGVMVVAGCGDEASESRAPTKTTEQRTFNPFTLDGKAAQSVEVTNEIGGSCGSSAEATARPDAWRCFADSDNEVRDPCFSHERAGYVLCAGRPWEQEVSKLALSEPLPDPGPAAAETEAGAGHPWGIELASGERCLFISGAGSAIAGKRVSYTCGKNIYLVGEPNRGAMRWSIERADEASMSLQSSAIAVVWN